MRNSQNDVQLRNISSEFGSQDFIHESKLFKSKGIVLLHGMVPYLADENDLRSVVLKENNLAFSGKKMRWELQSFSQ